MRIRRARAIMKSLADDTRLRIVNLLSKSRLNVTELRHILGANQSNLSKHLTRLRLTGLVSDRREGYNVYYFLRTPDDEMHKTLVGAVVKGLAGLEVFQGDLKKLRDLKKNRRA